jgi:uncharacterized protein (TIGR02231 family)
MALYNKILIFFVNLMHKTMKLMLLQILASIPLLVLGQQHHDQMSKTSAKEVTVYLNGAEIKTTERVNFKKGINRILLVGIPFSMVNESLQFSVGVNLEIVSITTQELKNDVTLIHKEASAVYSKIEQGENKLKLTRAKSEALDAERKMLLANQSIGGQQNGVSLIELAKAADFFRERVFKINTNLLENQKEAEILLHTIDSLKLIKSEIEERIPTVLKQITATIYSSAEQATEIELRYLVENANWEPTYDLIATDITKPIILKYKAAIYNQTGVDWNQAKIKLSSADPTQDATRPFLSTWTLNYTGQGNEGFINKYSSQIQTDTLAKVKSEEISVDELSYSFEIAKPHTITNGSSPYNIDIKRDSLKATYQYLTIPKLDGSAFLIAKVTGWQRLNLIDAPANVYFQNTYVGVSQINTSSVSDTLELSFGRDNKIMVARTKLEDTAGTKFIGGKRNEYLLYEISIKNNQRSPIDIKIQDQLPISQEADIVVEPNETSKASIDQLSGRLQWMKTIQSNQLIKLRIGFTVKYPKNKTVIIRKNRMVRTPRYRQ